MDVQPNDQPNDAPARARAPAPLPDFNQIGEAYGILHRQYPLMQNVPGHQDVLNAIQALRDYIDHRFTAVEGLLGQIRNKQLNSETRALNARIFSQHHSAYLQPLRNVDTGFTIDGFPRTVSELEGLDVVTADRIMTELRIEFDATWLLLNKTESIRRCWLG